MYAAVSLKEPFVSFLPIPGNEQNPKAPEGKSQPLSPPGQAGQPVCLVVGSVGRMGEDSW